MDDEQLRRRIVDAVDSLPVPAARGRLGLRARQRYGPPLSALAVAAAAALVVLVVLPLGIAAQRSASTDSKLTVITDDFSRGIDPQRWTTMGGGTGHAVRAIDGRVELALDANAVPGADGYMSATLGLLRCVARGDYEVSVDYVLLDWPAGSGTQLVLGEFPPGNAGVRRDQGDRERYGTNGQDGEATAFTTDTQGSLRLVRKGTSVTASYRSVVGGPWVELAAHPKSQFDATFQIFLFAGAREFGGKTVRVAIDNVRLAATTVVCV